MHDVKDQISILKKCKVKSSSPQHLHLDWDGEKCHLILPHLLCGKGFESAYWEILTNSDSTPFQVTVCPERLGKAIDYVNGLYTITLNDDDSLTLTSRTRSITLNAVKVSRDAADFATLRDIKSKITPSEAISRENLNIPNTISIDARFWEDYKIASKFTAPASRNRIQLENPFLLCGHLYGTDDSRLYANQTRIYGSEYLSELLNRPSLYFNESLSTHLVFGENKIAVKGEGFMIVTQRASGHPPNVTKVIPENLRDGSLDFSDTCDFIRKLMVKSCNNILTFEQEANTDTVEAALKVSGKSDNSIYNIKLRGICDYGIDLNLSINAEYLLDALREGFTHIKLSATKDYALAPTVLCNPEGSSKEFIVQMPMRG